MSAKPKLKQPRSSGKLPKWAGEMRDGIKTLAEELLKIQASLADEGPDGKRHISPGSLQSQINYLRERIGTSTPLIIWNIAVMIAIAGLGVAVAKLYGVAP